MLLQAPKAGYELIEVPIETIYLENNKSSHFRPLADSARIYFPFLSSIFNYSMNRRFVFAHGNKATIRRSLPRYFSLVVLILAIHYGLMRLFHKGIGIPLVAAKLLTEASCSGSAIGRSASSSTSPNRAKRSELR